MTSTLRVWHRDKDEQFAALTADSPLWLTHSSPVPSEEQRENAIAVHAIPSHRGTIGAALVPNELENTATLNGVPLRAGLHTLRHADRLDLDRQSLWFATDSVIETTAYDPTIHGEDIFCYLTKARLEPGQAIVVCPGAPGTTCPAIYTERAWGLAMNSATMRKCASCGFRPDESAWQPTEPQPRKRFDELINSLTEGHI